MKSPAESTSINVILRPGDPNPCSPLQLFAEVATLFRGIVELLPASCLAIHGESGKCLNLVERNNHLGIEKIQYDIFVCIYPKLNMNKYDFHIFIYNYIYMCTIGIRMPGITFRTFKIWTSSCTDKLMAKSPTHFCSRTY